MDNIPFDNFDRTELAQFLGEEVSFEGQVTNVKSPTKGKTFVCLRNVHIARRDDETVFSERPYVTCHHIWLETSAITHVKTRITDIVIGSCTVVPYTRKDGTHSFCLRFEQKGLTEGILFKRFVDNLDAIAARANSLTLDQQHSIINKLLTETEALCESGDVYFHSDTRSSFLKKLRERRGSCMRRAGITLPANRAGRRFRREQGRSRHRIEMPKAHGFS